MALPARLPARPGGHRQRARPHGQNPAAPEDLRGRQPHSAVVPALHQGGDQQDHHEQAQGGPGR